MNRFLAKKDPGTPRKTTDKGLYLAGFYLKVVKSGVFAPFCSSF